MGSRPLLIALASLTALLGTVLAPAGADVVRTRTVPDSLQVVDSACAPGTPGGDVTVVTSPPGIPYPSGTGSLQLHQGDVDDVVGIGRDFALLSALTSVAVRYHDPDEYGTAWYEASTWVDIRVTTSNGTYHLLWPLDQLGHATSWGSGQLFATTPFHVRKEDDNTWVPQPDATVPDFVALHGDGSGVVQVVRAPCYAALTSGDPSRTPPPGIGAVTYVDRLRIAFTGEDPPTYDFEDHIVNLSMSVGQTLITAGETTTISGGVTRDGAPYAGATVELLKQRWDASGWKTVGTTVSTSKGRVALKVRPEVNTRYKWSYPDLRLTSPSLGILVRTKLTLGFEDTSLRKGGTLVARGTVLPADRRYTTITLMRRTSSGSVLVARGNDNGTGHYRISTTMKDPGTYRLFVTIPATAANERGSSVTKRVTVE